MGEVCCVCKEPVVSGSVDPHERWSWGPDGLHCHQRCEGGFARVMRERGLDPPDYVLARERPLPAPSAATKEKP